MYLCGAWDGNDAGTFFFKKIYLFNFYETGSYYVALAGLEFGM